MIAGCLSFALCDSWHWQHLLFITSLYGAKNVHVHDRNIDLLSQCQCLDHLNINVLSYLSVIKNAMVDDCILFDVHKRALDLTSPTVEFLSRASRAAPLRPFARRRQEVLVQIHVLDAVRDVP